MNPRTRVLGLAILGCGALLCILPALPWYSADLPTGADRLTGYGATAVTWILPVAGGMLVAAGLLAAWWQPSTGTRVARLLGGLVVVCAITATTWAARAALGTTIQVVAERPGRAAAPLEGEWSVTVLPAAWISIAAAALAGMAGILLLIARSEDMIRPDDSGH